MKQNDLPWLKTLTRCHFGSEKIIIDQAVFFPHKKDGFVAFDGAKRVGVIVYQINDSLLEIILLDALQSKPDIFKSLLAQISETAIQANCARIRVTTTNDNTDALQLYQQKGFQICALRKNAVTAARKIKPEIPETGDNSIPIRDEIELEKYL